MTPIPTKKLITTYIALLIANIFMLIMVSRRVGAYNLDGSYSPAGSTRLLFSAIMGILMLVPLVSSLLALQISFFLNKKETYGKRFKKVFLLLLVIGYIITLLGFLRTYLMS